LKILSSDDLRFLKQWINDVEARLMQKLKNMFLKSRQRDDVQLFYHASPIAPASINGTELTPSVVYANHATLDTSSGNEVWKADGPSEPIYNRVNVEIPAGFTTCNRDHRSGRWFAEVSAKAVEASKLRRWGIASLCSGITNECCLFDGRVVHNDDPKNCDHDQCVKKVWITCENRELLPDYDYNVGGAWVDSYGNRFSADYCDWARSTGKLVTCDEEEREVYAVRCPCIPCTCPNPAEEVVKAKITYPNGTCDNVDGIEFSLGCISQDPITGYTVDNTSPAPNPFFGWTMWWGEFTISGRYPMIGYEMELDPDFEITLPSGDTTPIVYTVLLPGNDPCNPTIEYWADDDGDWVEVFSPVFDEDASLGAPELIFNSDNEVMTRPVTFRYGMRAHCDPLCQAAGVPTVKPDVIYHLPPDQYLPRTTDSCDGVDWACGLEPVSSNTPLVSVPSDGNTPDVDFPEPEGITGTPETDSCCYISPKWDLSGFDPDFGQNSIPVCGEVGPFSNLGDLVANTLEWHVFGGCPDFIKDMLRTIFANPLLELDVPSMTPGALNIQFEWGRNREECEELESL